MTKRFEKALASWPKAVPSRDGGVRITGGYEQPTFDSYTVAAVLLTLAIALYTGLALESWLAGIVVVVTAAVIWNVMGVSLFGRKLDIRVYPDRIEVPSLLGRKRYSRDMPMEFRVEQHQKAIEEETLEHRTRKRQRRIFREALEVVLQYGEKRVVLAEMRQKHMEMARALVIRLQNVCADVDLVQMVRDAGRPAGAAGEFGPAPDIR